MTEDSAGLAAKIEREMKFTRSTVLLCTAAILGTLFLNLTMMTGQVPDLILLKLEGGMGTLETRIAQVQKTLDQNFAKGGAAKPADEKAPAAAK